jgi:glycosyltransferase involved in cell wall biosynthesis
MRVAIDAANLRQGGGVTHLVQLLAAADPSASGIERVTVFGAQPLLEQLPAAPWLTRVAPRALDRGGLGRAGWQQAGLATAARQCADVLFSPGGIYLGGFTPFVTMFRNMLTFDDAERRRYGASRLRLKLEILRYTQRATFRRANGLIFLNEHARSVIQQAGIDVRGRDAVIPHGVDSRFTAPLRPQHALSEYSSSRPFRWVYVSAIHEYKRMPQVVAAVAALRDAGLPIALDIVGPAHAPALCSLEREIDRVDASRAFIRVRGNVPHAALPQCYHEADAFVFASTCENMPNSLLEAMAAGLPIACSDREPMLGMLKGAGVLFDSNRSATIAAAMRSLLESPSERARLGAAAQAIALQYTWSRCARDTFDFLARVSAR